MGDRYEDAFNFCFKEMFLRVGEKYPNKTLTNDPNWYMLRSWSIEEEEKFQKWMIWYLRKKLRITIKSAEKEASFFSLMYSWTNQFPLAMKVIKQ